MSKTKENSELAEIYQTILEEMDSSDVFGDVSHEAALENEDTYAPGDNRYPYLMGLQTRGGKVGKGRKKKKSKSGVPSAAIPKNL